MCRIMHISGHNSSQETDFAFRILSGRSVIVEVALRFASHADIGQLNELLGA